MNSDHLDHVLYMQGLSELQNILAPICQHYSKVFVLCDEHTMAECFPPLAEGCIELKDAELIVVEPGEGSKCMEIAQHIIIQLIESEADKNTLLINLGGGVITDLGGWIASNYKRGIPFIHIPTSLMAMTDASLGGKTGLNIGAYKNMIGTIHFAKHTLVCAEFLETLPNKEMLSGRAEMVKHALLTNATLYLQCIESLGSEADVTIAEIKASADIKMRIVKQDRYEENLRKTLNFGHSVGHALESYFLACNTPITHGLAVASGMAVEVIVSKNMSLAQNLPSDQIAKDLIFHFDLTEHQWPTFEDWYSYLLNDKKNSNGHIKMALLKDFGACEINVQVSKNQIQTAYTTFLSLLQIAEI